MVAKMLIDIYLMSGYNSYATKKANVSCEVME